MKNEWILDIQYKDNVVMELRFDDFDEMIEEYIYQKSISFDTIITILECKDKEYQVIQRKEIK